MTDEQVLARIERGHLRVEGGPPVRVFGFHPTRGRWKEIKVQRHPGSGRARVNLGPRRKPVYLNRRFCPSNRG